MNNYKIASNDYHIEEAYQPTYEDLIEKKFNAISKALHESDENIPDELINCSLEFLKETSFYNHFKSNWQDNVYASYNGTIAVVIERLHNELGLNFGTNGISIYCKINDSFEFYEYNKLDTQFYNMIESLKKKLCVTKIVPYTNKLTYRNPSTAL